MIFAIDARLCVFWAESFVEHHREHELRVEAGEEEWSADERAAKALLNGTEWLHWHLTHADAFL
jgi:hypothetical protein